ncbi:MAG: hypothetical protein KPEEDBHJ_00887 [Anaerolineales bacterium]|nr:hypothetical protein [Anaerolineales bacterium]
MDEKNGEPSEVRVAPPILDAGWKRVLSGLFVAAAPVFNFSFINLLKPEWQDGKLSSRIILFLLPESALYFFSLLAYAIICYILLLWDSDRYAKFFPIRLGVYGGTALALQYTLLTIPALQGSALPYILLCYISPFVFSRFQRWLSARWGTAFAWGLPVGLGVLAFIASLFLTGSASTPFVFILFFLGISAPFWSFLVALQASRWLWKHHETTLTLRRGLGVFAWLGAYAFALRFNILKMFELYNALPAEPPNCYIAAAAAKGHPRFVGSTEVTLANGKTMRVNRQLKRLKALEIAWAGVSAPSHRKMRRVYDLIGKRLAQRIQNPILADIAYLLLIPVEYASFFALQWIVPEIQSLSDRLYHS